MHLARQVMRDHPKGGDGSIEIDHIIASQMCQKAKLQDVELLHLMKSIEVTVMSTELRWNHRYNDDFSHQTYRIRLFDHQYLVHAPECNVTQLRARLTIDSVLD